MNYLNFKNEKKNCITKTLNRNENNLKNKTDSGQFF